MVGAMPCPEAFVFVFIGKQRLHAGNFKLHLNVGREFINHLGHGKRNILLGVEGRTDCRKKMGVCGIDNMLLVKLQGADKCGFQF